MLPRPSTARFVIHRKRANRMREIAQQGRITELGFIELRDEERTDRHAGAVRLNDGPRKGVDSPHTPI